MFRYLRSLFLVLLPFLHLQMFANNVNLPNVSEVVINSRDPFDVKGSLGTIPHYIHFLNLDDRPLLDIEKGRIQSWQKAHPEWQLKTWTKNNIHELNLYTKELFRECVSPEIQLEILRLEVLHQYGGICLDMNIECLKPFDTLVSNCDFFAGSSHEDNSTLKVSLIGAKPFHPIIRSTLDKLQTSNGSLSFDQLLTQSFQEVGNQGTKDIALHSRFFYPVPTEDQQKMIPLETLWANYKHDEGQAIQLCHSIPEIVMIVPSYNNGRNNQNACIKNLDSIRKQKWPYLSAIIIDDNSTDNNCELISSYIKKYGLEQKITLVRNPVNKGACANNYFAIHSVAKKKVIFCLDGDDSVNTEDDATVIASAYADKKTWVTYGTYQFDDRGPRGDCRPVSEAVCRDRSFRKGTWFYSHPKTFYAKLYQLIKLEDLQRNGDFYTITQDQVFMFRLLEMASKGHIKFISRILYKYNTQNPICDFKKNVSLQLQIEQELKHMTPYEPVELW